MVKCDNLAKRYDINLTYQGDFFVHVTDNQTKEKIDFSRSDSMVQAENILKGVDSATNFVIEKENLK